MAKYSWVDVDQLEDAIASGRFNAEALAAIPGLAPFSAPARRDAAMAELLAANNEAAIFPISAYSGDLGAAIQSAHDALPAYGGIIDARSATGAQTMAADLTLNKKLVTIWWPRAQVTTTKRIIVPAGTDFLTLRGPVMLGGLVGGAVDNQAYISYEGTGTFLTVGDASTPTIGFVLQNMNITLSLAGASAGALRLNNTKFFELNQSWLLGAAAAVGQVVLLCDGTGGYTGSGLVRSCRIENGHHAIHLSGVGVNASNVTAFENLSCSGTAGKTGVLIDAGSNGNVFLGADLENWGTAVEDHFGFNVFLGTRCENNTVDFNWASGCTRSAATITSGSTPVTGLPIVTDNSGNHTNKAVQVGDPIPATAQTLTDAVTIAWDLASGEYATVTLTDNRTVGLPSNPRVGQRIILTVIQDGTGGRTLGWNAVFKQGWSDTGNTANKRSTIAFIYDGTNWNQVGAQSPYV